MLTNVERLTLAKQHAILEKLSSKDEDKRHHNFIYEVLMRGYTDFYNEIFHELKHENSFLRVFDIFDMYRDMTFAYRNSEFESINEEDIVFQGFDGNEEGEYYQFVTFFLEKTNQYSEIKETNDRILSTLNSHTPMLNKYLRQTEIWQQHKEGTSTTYLTEDQITELINA